VRVRFRHVPIVILLPIGLGLWTGSDRGARARPPCDDAVGTFLEHDAATSRGEAWVAAQQAFSVGRRWSRQDLSSSQRKAIELFTRAHEAWRRTGDALGQARALSAMGTAQLRLDQRTAALHSQEQALALLERTSPVEACVEAEVRRGLGQAYLANDRAQEALFQLHGALDRARQKGDVVLQANVLVDLGASYHALRRFSPAFASYEEALTLVRRWAIEHPEDRRLREQASVVYNIGASHQQEIRYKPARARFEEALALYRAAGDRHGEAKALNRLGALASAAGDNQRALEYGRRALALNLADGEEGINAYILHNLGGAHALRGEWDEALRYHEAALAIRRRIGNQTGTAASLLRVGLARVAQGQLETALPFVEQALETAEQIRSRLSDPDFRSYYFSSFKDYFDGYVDLLLKLHARHPGDGYLARAFEATERSRARGLLDALGPDARTAKGAPARLDDLRRLRETLNTLATCYDRLLAGRADPAEIRRLDESIDLALSRRQMLEAAELAPRPPLSLPQIQRDVLDPDTLLLQYWLGRHQSLLFLVAHDHIRMFVLDRAAAIEARARGVSERLVARQRYERFETLDEREARLAQADAEYEQEAAALSEMILASAAPYLGRKRLLVAPDGMLHSIPFAALPDPRSAEPLVLAHEISYVPSVSILAGLRQDRRKRHPAPLSILVVNDPVFGADDPRVAGPGRRRSGRFQRLPHTGREAQAVARLVPPPQGRIASGFEATRGLVQGPEVGRYRIVHFATHALVNNTHPALSGILLSQVGPDGREQEGMLRAHEVVDLKLSADLVVLSSCSTGVGRNVQGEGLMSLTRAFIRAGAGRVMVSSWDVDDAATAELMSRFYESLFSPRSPAPAAALRAAQLALWRDPGRHAPYYWAAFAIHGEYRRPLPKLSR
jgi:CHAT domain-containing protein